MLFSSPHTVGMGWSALMVLSLYCARLQGFDNEGQKRGAGRLGAAALSCTRAEGAGREAGGGGGVVVVGGRS